MSDTTNLNAVMLSKADGSADTYGVSAVPKEDPIVFPTMRLELIGNYKNVDQWSTFYNAVMAKDCIFYYIFASNTGNTKVPCIVHRDAIIEMNQNTIMSVVIGSNGNTTYTFSHSEQYLAVTSSITFDIYAIVFDTNS